jgi:hypothetical protein
MEYKEIVTVLGREQDGKIKVHTAGKDAVGVVVFNPQGVLVALFLTPSDARAIANALDTIAADMALDLAEGDRNV